jgi:hypothetical protein
MDQRLDQTLRAIGKEYESKIAASSRNYLEVDIGRRAAQLGFSDIEEKYSAVLAVVPLKAAEHGMKVRIDGRTFVDYGQLDSGIAVPGYVVRKSSLAFRSFIPNDSMILNFV